MKRPRFALWVVRRWRCPILSEAWGFDHLPTHPILCPAWLFNWAVWRVEKWHEDPKCGKFDHVEVDTPIRWKPLTVNEPADWKTCRVMKDDH